MDLRFGSNFRHPFQAEYLTDIGKAGMGSVVAVYLGVLEGNKVSFFDKLADAASGGAFRIDLADQNMIECLDQKGLAALLR